MIKSQYNIGFIIGLLFGAILPLLMIYSYSGTNVLLNQAIESYVKSYHKHSSQERFYAYTPQGRSFQIIPLDEKHMSTAALISTLSQVVYKTLSFNVDTVESHLKGKARYFSKGAQKDLQKSFGALYSQLSDPDTIYSIETRPLSAPVLRKQELQKGQLHWSGYMTVKIQPIDINNIPTDYTIEARVDYDLKRAITKPLHQGFLLTSWNVTYSKK